MDSNQKDELLHWQRYAVLFIFSQGITLFGSSIVQMAIIWQVALETSSGLWVTLLTLCATVPQTIVAPFAGVWADRYPRRRLIMLADGGIAAITLVLALVLWQGTLQNILPLLMVVSALRSLGTGVQMPAVSAVIPQIVPEKHLMRYNGINGSMMSIVQFAAPAVAGAVLSMGAFRWVLILDVATALVGILILSFVRIKHTASQKGSEPFFADMKAGISYAFRDKLIGRSLFIFGAFIVLSVPSGFLTVLLIQRTFGDRYILLTIAEMVGFAGMVLGGGLIGLWGGFKNRQKTLLLGLVLYGTFSIALGVASIFWVFAALLGALSLAIPFVQSALTTILQENVPTDKQGRIFGLLGAIYSGFMPLGMAVFGPLADVVSIQGMMIFCGLGILFLGLSLVLFKKE